MRAREAERLGLVRSLDLDARADARIMTRAIRALPAQRKPSELLSPGMLDGLEQVVALARPHFLKGEDELAVATSAG